MFSEDELEAARHLTVPRIARPARPFELDRCLDIYESGLPRTETRTTQAWRTERWIEDWGCDPSGRRYEGLLSHDEAKFWWVAWTLTGRLGDDAQRAGSVDILRTAWANAAHEEADAEWCWRRLQQFHDAAKDYYDVWALTSMAPSATMLRVLLGRPAALGMVLNFVPAERLAPWIEWVGPPTLAELEDYSRHANAWAAAHAPSLDTMQAWRTLALHARTPEVIGPARSFAHDHRKSRGADGWLLDLARADARPGSFSAWLVKGRGVPTPELACEMVARDGDAGIAAIATILGKLSARGTTNRVPEAQDLVVALGELSRVELVDPMLGLLSRPDTATQARGWLRAHGPEHLQELIRLASTRTTTRQAAVDVLTELRRLQPAAVDDAIAALGADERAQLREAMGASVESAPELDPLPQWATRFVAIDSWADQLPDTERALLPPLIVDGKRLPDDVVDGILATLSDVRLELDLRSGASRDEVPASLEGLREELDPQSADRFAKALFDVWLRSDDHNATRWCMRSVAFLGGDGSLDHVVDAVIDYRKWLTAEDALSALDAVRRQGTPYAIAQLGWLSEFHRAPRIRAHARIELEAIANARHRLVDAVVDQNVPDFVDSPATAPHVARRRTEVVRDLHAARWERAMVEYKTFDYELWRRDVLEHPILRQLARTVLWMVATDDGGFLAAVRVGEDFELSDVGESPMPLQPGERVGVVHPAELAPAELHRWNELFADYELVQPFEQLDRPVYRPHDTPNFEPMETQILRARMAKNWSARRGKNQMIVGFYRRFEALGITAHIELAEGFEIRPIAAGGLVPVDAEVDRIYFESEWGEVPADAVPPGVYSEVVSALAKSARLR